ncbi:hypothetical protein, partial [Xanthomonas arboricola]
KQCSMRANCAGVISMSNSLTSPATSVNRTYRISEQWTATLAVRNAFDKTYWANLDYQNYGEPRFVSLSLRWRY